MNEDQRRKVAEIRTAIQNGSLTSTEIERRLSAAIEVELSKTDSPADMQWVMACQDLLWELQAGGDKTYVSNIDVNRMAVEQKIKLNDRRRTIQKGSMRIAAVAAAIFILAIVGDGLLNRGWIKGHSSEDEQQYVIQGQAIQSGLVPEGAAGDEAEPADLATADLQEAVEFLGFKPDMPTWLPVSWEAMHFYVSIGEDNRRFNVSYVHKEREEDALFYETRIFSDAENAYTTFEQNKEGGMLDISGETVYFTQNEDKVTYVWYNGLTVYTLSGTVSQDEMKKIIISIGGSSTS